MRRVKKFRLYLAAALLAVTSLCAQQASTRQKNNAPPASTPQTGAQQPSGQKYCPCEPPCQFRFVVYGDTRNNEVATKNDNEPSLKIFGGDKTHRMILDEVVKYNPQLILQTGDLVNNGGEAEEWKHFRSITRYDKTAHTVREVSYYPAPGNHDKCNKNEYATFIPSGVQRDGETFHYYFDFSSNKVTTPDKVIIRFISIDTVPDNRSACAGGSGKVDEHQLEQLGRELKAAKDARESQDPKQKKNIFVVPFFHHPIYSIGKHGGNDYDGTSRNNLEGKFKAKDSGVRLVFQGHDHNYYYRKEGDITYVVSGGGGAQLYNKDKENQKAPNGDDFFLYAYNFSVCDVYPEWIEVKTYASASIDPKISSDKPKSPATAFTLRHEFVVRLAQ